MSDRVDISVEIDPALMLRSNQHLRDLMAEMRVIASGEKTHSNDRPLPAELAEAVDSILSQYAAVAEATNRIAEEASQRGESNVRVEMTLPKEASGAARQILSAIEHADEYCRDGTLLTLPAPEDVAAFRRSYIGEIIRQLETA